MIDQLTNCFCFSLFTGHHLAGHSHLKTWKDVSEGDIKIFLAQLIAMGLVRKTSIESYWDYGEIVRTPFLTLTCLRIIFKIFCQIFIL